MFLQQCATVHRTIATEHSTGLLFLPITIACCLCITRLGLVEKLRRLAMFIKFRSIRICKTTPDLPFPTNTAVRSQQRLNTPEAQKVSNFYFVNDNLLFHLYFQEGGMAPLAPPWLRLCFKVIFRFRIRLISYFRRQRVPYFWPLKPY